MKFTIATLMMFVTAFAIAFAMVRDPTAWGSEAIHSLQIIAGCTALVVARYTTGGLHAYALTFGIFGFAMPILHACPYSLQQWLYENVTYDGPDTLETGNGWEVGPFRTIAAWFNLLTSMFAASLASSIVRSSASIDS